MSYHKYTNSYIIIGTDWRNDMDNIIIDLSDKKHLYLQIYEYFKKEIEVNNLKQGEKLPSIRGLSGSLAVSKITVEKAYDQLFSEGYIENNNRSRYVVAPIYSDFIKHSTPQNNEPVFSKYQSNTKIKYNFSSGEMDPDGFDFSLWKKYINRTLTDNSNLFHYGDIKGEYALREQIIRYLHSSRGVSAQPHQIVIGPGVRSLLGILARLLKDKFSSVAFEDPGFKNGRLIFADNSYYITPIKMQQSGIDMQALEDSKAKLVYISPSHQFPTGTIMPIGRRNKLLNWVEETNGYIIEDDYDSEFRYFGNPIPALKGLDTKDRVIYLGSFSKIIPPSIRISYMLLPQSLAELFELRSKLYTPSVSVTEQLALAEFIAEGHLEKQIRRLRKLYSTKRQMFLDEIQRQFGDDASVYDIGSGLFVTVSVKSQHSIDELKKSAENNACKITFMQDYALNPLPNSMAKQLILYFSSIPLDDIGKSIRALKKSLL